MMPGIASLAGLGAAAGGGGGGGASTPTAIAAGSMDASTGSTVAPGYPSGVVAGRYAILFVHHFSQTAGAATFTTPSGWTLINSVTSGDWRGAAFYKKLIGSESGTVTVSSSKSPGSGGIYMGVISIWDGVHATTPIGTSAGAAVGWDTNWYGSDITTTVNNARVVNMYGGWQLRSSTAQTGWTELYQLTTLIGGDGWVACTYQDKATAGLVSKESRQAESGNSAWSCITFDLLPP